MNRQTHHPVRRRKPSAAFTLVELMVCVALGVLVLGVVVSLTTFAMRSFIVLGNYQSLDNQSRNTLDRVCRDMREATAVLACQTNLPTLSLTLTNANQGQAMVLTWNSNGGTFVYSNSYYGAETNLTGCDNWSFALFQRTPVVTATNVTFFPATNTSGQLTLPMCKLVDMSWKCSRTIFGSKVNTETVQTAQIVLRNAQ
jgi:Tfp pilus assembly protein PilW